MSNYGGGELLLCCIAAVVFAVPEWMAEIEHIWKNKWLGYCLIAVSCTTFLWLNWHLPPSGYAVVAMAVVAGIMAIRPEMGGWERSLWFVVLVCFAIIEIRAITHDREQAKGDFTEIATGLKTSVDQGKIAIDGLQTTIKEGREHFDTTLQTENKNMTQTLRGLKETVNAATGGDSFCYALLVPPGYAGNPAAISSIIPRGKYPLTNVNALVTDDDMMVQYLNGANNTGRSHSADEFANIMQRAQEWIHLGDLPPNFSEQFSMRAATVTGDRRMLSIFFWANNGNWIEKFALRRVNGKWLRLIRVWKERLDKKNKAMVADVIFEQIDEGFPEDTKPSSGLSPSPSH
jgi:hypothetical protein